MIVFIKLIDVGGPSPPWAAPFPSLGVLSCGRVEKWNRAQAREYALAH